MVARAQSQELGSTPSPQYQEDKSKGTYSTSISQDGKLEGSGRNTRHTQSLQTYGVRR